MPHKWDLKCRFPAGLVRPVRVDPTGITGPTPHQARGPSWRRTSHGFYVPAGTGSDPPEQRILEASVHLRPGSAVTGWAAARLRGANLFDGLEPDGRTRIPVPLAVSPTGRPRPSELISISYERLANDEVVTLHGIPATTRERATFDAMRRTDDLRESVVDLDMMMAAEQTSAERMHAYADARRGWAKVAQVRHAVDLASEHSRSPNESRLRLIWVLDVQLPMPLVNCSVLDRTGRLLGTADLLDPVAGLVVEYDGADHRAARRHGKDVEKEDRFRRVGLEVTRVTGPDLPDHPRVVDRVLSARSRASFEPALERRWIARPLADDLEAKLQHREDLERWMSDRGERPAS